MEVGGLCNRVCTSGAYLDTFGMKIIRTGVMTVYSTPVCARSVNYAHLGISASADFGANAF